MIQCSAGGATNTTLTHCYDLINKGQYLNKSAKVLTESHPPMLLFYLCTYARHCNITKSEIFMHLLVPGHRFYKALLKYVSTVENYVFNSKW